MSTPTTNALLPDLSEFIRERTGLHFPEERWSDLERGVRSAAPALGFEEAEPCIRWLLSSPLTREQIEVLASHLTVGETYFFRETQAFEVLEEEILPGLIRFRQGRDRRLRIWSAGCSTGEEPYSIAIVVSRLIPELADWNVTILATDINRQFLQKAARGVYIDWSFRDVPSWVKEGYFRKTGEGRYEVLPRLKKRVTFAYQNLVEDVYPSLLNNTNAMDIVFCRNVLMYFAPEQVEKVLERFHCSLVDGGWLIVGSVEASRVFHFRFAAVNFAGWTVYRKGRRDHPARPDATVAPARREPCSIGPSPDETEERNPYDEALVLYEHGLYSEAAEKLAALHSKEPGNAQALALLARACANSGKLAEAQSWIEKAIAADKLDAAARYLHAIVLRERGVFDDAVASLNRALYLDPDFVLAHFALGNLVLHQGKFQEAARHFENALALLNDYPGEKILPESEGIAAGRLREIIHTAGYREKGA